MLSINLSLFLPKMPTLLLILKYERKVTANREKEGGSIQIKDLVKKVA